MYPERVPRDCLGEQRQGFDPHVIATYRSQETEQQTYFAPVSAPSTAALVVLTAILKSWISQASGLGWVISQSTDRCSSVSTQSSARSQNWLFSPIPSIRAVMPTAIL